MQEGACSNLGRLLLSSKDETLRELLMLWSEGKTKIVLDVLRPLIVEGDMPPECYQPFLLAPLNIEHYNDHNTQNWFKLLKGQFTVNPDLAMQCLKTFLPIPRSNSAFNSAFNFSGKEDSKVWMYTRSLFEPVKETNMPHWVDCVCFLLTKSIDECTQANTLLSEGEPRLLHTLSNLTYLTPDGIVKKIQDLDETLKAQLGQALRSCILYSESILESIKKAPEPNKEKKEELVYSVIEKDIRVVACLLTAVDPVQAIKILKKNYQEVPNDLKTSFQMNVKDFLNRIGADTGEIIEKMTE